MRRAKRLPVTILVFRKRWITAACCVALSALLLGIVNYPAAVDAAASTRQLPIYCVQRDQKMLSISFDAAWGNEDTQQLIDILGRYGVRATFFVVGDWVDRYPESVKALHDAGHEVMNHSNSHAHLPQLSAQEIAADMNACNDKVEAVTGVRPTLMRPPYGDYDDNSIRAIRALGMEPIQWDVEPLATVGDHCVTMPSIQSRPILKPHIQNVTRQQRISAVAGLFTALWIIYCSKKPLDSRSSYAADIVSLGKWGLIFLTVLQISSCVFFDYY